MDLAAPQGHELTVNHDMTLHYQCIGQGHPVLFIHGSGPGASGWSNFKGNASYLAEHGIQAIVPDLPGYGASSKPRHIDYHFDYMTSCLEQLIDHLRLSTFSIIGNSLGGALAIRMALNNPKTVSKLVLMAPGGLESRETYMQMPGIKQMVATFFAEGGITRDGIRQTFELQLFDKEKITDATIDERFSVAVTQPKRVIATLNIPNQTDVLANLTCPILGFWGMNDQFCPPSGAMKIMSRCKNARMTLLSECGHWVMVEHADLFNKQCAAFLSTETIPTQSN